MSKIACCSLACLLLVSFSCHADDVLTSPDATVTGRGSGEAYAFPFFYHGVEGERLGMWMAVSLDGLDWTIVNNNKVVWKRPFGTVFRDPAISQGPDGVYHLVWTTDWDGNTGVGYAMSRDMLHWEDARVLDLMKTIPGTVNLWAPELFYDRDEDRWMIYWGSSVQGKFSDTVQPNRPRANNRMYCAFTKDFRSFTPPQLLLGDHIVNDTRIVNVDSGLGNYCMVTKHIIQPGKAAQLYLMYSNQIDGPYQRVDLSRYDYVSKPYRFCEGPAVIKIGAWYYLYMDLSREHRMACKRNREMQAEGWEDVTERLNFPSGVKHGDVIRIPRETYDQLLSLRMD